MRWRLMWKTIAIHRRNEELLDQLIHVNKADERRTIWWRNAHGVTIFDIEYEHGDLNSNPGEFICILHLADTLEKGMNPTILSPAGKKCIANGSDYGKNSVI